MCIEEIVLVCISSPQDLELLTHTVTRSLNFLMKKNWLWCWLYYWRRSWWVTMRENTHWQKKIMLDLRRKILCAWKVYRHDSWEKPTSKILYFIEIFLVILECCHQGWTSSFHFFFFSFFPLFLYASSFSPSLFLAIGFLCCCC